MDLNEDTGFNNGSDGPVRTIIDHIPILAWTARPDGSVEFVNRQWLDYTGLSEDGALDWHGPQRFIPTIAARCWIGGQRFSLPESQANSKSACAATTASTVGF